MPLNSAAAPICGCAQKQLCKAKAALRHARARRRHGQDPGQRPDEKDSNIAVRICIATGCCQTGPLTKLTPRMTTMPALLVLHLEAALDPSESDLVRSMSRISISQTMLALNQLREIPAIKKAIPLFELILSRKKLDGDGDAVVHMPKVAALCESQGKAAGVVQRPQLDAETDDALGESFDSFVQEFLEYDTLGEWGFAQVDFSRLV